MSVIKGGRFGLMLMLMWCALTVRANDLAYLQQGELEQVKSRLAAHRAPALTNSAYQQLLRQADKALDLPLMSVTQKGMTPSSGSKHDYLSLSAYWWPDNSKPDGLPWIRRDGKINPASKNEQSDGTRLPDFTAAVQNLTMAWYFSADRRYSDKAIALIDTWFINPETRMAPNLNFAQGVPGVAEGRGSGVLDGRYFATRVVDSLILLRQAPGWQPKQEQALQQWMGEYLDWLLTSKLGKKEASAMNNHGNWYAVQVAGIAWYLHKPQVIRDMVKLSAGKLDHQLAADGSQPEELARTRSFHYSYFNLQALTLLAQLAPQAKADDLWQVTTAKGASLIKALDFMAPYSNNRKTWPYHSLDRVSVRLIPLMSLADNQLRQTRYQDAIRQADFQPGHDGDSYEDKVSHGGVVMAQRDTWLLSLPAFAQQE